MASPYNTTDEMNSQSNSSNSMASKGTQISKTAQTSRVFDANDSQTTDSISQEASTDRSADRVPKQASAQPKKQTKNQEQDFDQAPRSMNQRSEIQGSGVDVLRGTLTNAFDQIVKEIEPQISEFASNFAHQAMDKGTDYGRQAVQRVQKQSWGRIGLAAALIVGAVAVLGYQATEALDQDSLH